MYFVRDRHRLSPVSGKRVMSVFSMFASDPLCLAIILQLLGHLKGAKQQYESALEIHERVLGHSQETAVLSSVKVPIKSLAKY